MAHKFGVVVAEDEPLVRDRIAGLLQQSDTLTLLAAVGSLTEARDACFRLRPEALLIDLRLPDGHGLTLIREIRAKLPHTRIMVISVLADEASVLDAIRAGAGGYLLKDDPPEDFTRAVRHLVRGEASLSPAVARHIVRQLQGAREAGPPANEHSLTPREMEVLAFISKGLSNPDIATRLSISVHTVGDHVKNIYRKLEVRSRSEAVFQGISRRLLQQ